MTTKVAVKAIIERIESEGYRVKHIDSLINRIVNYGQFTNEDSFISDLSRATNDNVLEALE